MKVLDIFKKKNTDQKMEPKEVVQTPPEECFVYGVEDVFKLKDCDDLVVVGIVRGTVKSGMAVYVSNIGDDDNVSLVTTVQGLEIQGKTVDSATNCHVALRLQSGQKANIKIGSVVFTRDMSTKEVHDAYINAIGNAYVAMRKLELSEKETESMSIADMVETWRLFSWKQSQMVNTQTDSQKEENRNKVAKLAEALIGKIFNSEEIYVVFNKRTGEPHMFSRTIDQKDGTYCCTSPDILVIPKAYSHVFAELYSKDDYEMKKIENGEDKKGIYNFFGSTFYLNGACGIDIIGSQTAIDASKLIPMKKEGEIPTPDENGKTVLKKGVQIQFPTMKGKHERDAVRMFTDWKRLRMVYDEEWSGMLQPVSGMIDVFDCAINATECPEAGCYIDKQMFELATKRNEG